MLIEAKHTSLHYHLDFNTLISDLANTDTLPTIDTKGRTIVQHQGKQIDKHCDRSHFINSLCLPLTLKISQNKHLC